MAETRLTVLQMLPALESGGVERGTLEMARYLVERGHRSIVMSAGGRLVEQLRQEGSEHAAWDIGRKSPWTLRLVPRLRRFLRDNRVDILHLRSRMPGWVGYLAWKGMARDARPHLVTTVHGLYSVNRYSAVMVRGERVIAVSETVRDYIVRNYPAVDPGRIQVIFRGVAPGEFPRDFHPSRAWLATWQAQYPQLAGKRVLSLPGRITRLKGHEDFIRLIGALKAAGLAVHGLIIGGAAPDKRRYLDELARSVAAQGLAEDISFTGLRSDMREVFSQSDAVLALSTQPESFGRTTLEALALGVPVIGWDKGGVGEILARVFPAGRVDTGNVAQLEARVRQLLESGSRPGPIPDCFALDRMCAETLELYHALDEQCAVGGPSAKP